MRIAVAATPAIALPAIKALHHRHEIAFVITQPDKPTGRGLRTAESPIAVWAHQEGIEVLKPKKISDIEDRLATVDLVATIAYGQLVKASSLAQPRYGFINLHYSLLPRWRGAAPVQWALLEGDHTTGVTVFKLDEGMDTGPIYVQREIEVGQGWASERVFNELNELGSVALLESIAMIEEGRAPSPQKGESTHARKIEKEDYLLDIHLDAVLLHRKIKALYPRAYFIFHGSKVKVLESELGPRSLHEPGECLSSDPFLLSTGGESSLVLVTVIPEGRRAMSAVEWARGARIASGARIG